MKKLIFKIAAVCMALVLVVSLCGCAGNNKTSLIKNPKLEESTYKLDDTMGDYTLTDINGNTYNFSEILKQKEAIVLNFWFANCDPCKMEFPYLQEAAEEYSDDITVIAINPVDAKEARIKKFVEENKLTLPVVMGDAAWSTAFSIKGYPTTIVIDRFGKIAFNHMGAITEEGVFEEIFDFFTDDDYVQTTIKNLDEIKQLNKD